MSLVCALRSFSVFRSVTAAEMRLWNPSDLICSKKSERQPAAKESQRQKRLTSPALALNQTTTACQVTPGEDAGLSSVKASRQKEHAVGLLRHSERDRLIFAGFLRLRGINISAYVFFLKLSEQNISIIDAWWLLRYSRAHISRKFNVGFLVDV